MELSEGGQARIDGVKVSFKGGIRAGSVSPGGRLSPGTRGAARDALADLLDGAEFRQSAALDVEVTSVDAPGTRGAREGVPTVVLEAPPLQDDEACHVLLVEDDGELHWEFQQPRTGDFELSVDADLRAARGVLGEAARKAVRFLAVKALQKGTKPAARGLARLAEQRLRPHRLRTFTATDFNGREAAEPDLAKLTKGPSLLLVHGTNSATHEAFCTLDAQWVRALCERYGDRVVAFDHPSLSVSPADNAQWLRDALLRDNRHAYTFDVMAHSRGGLVARELVERIKDARIKVRSVLFVATPNNGTVLADANHVKDFLDVLTNLAAVLPDNPFTDAMTVLFELVKDVALDLVHDALPGISAMEPEGEYLAKLNALGRPDDVAYRALAADFEPLSTHGMLTTLQDRLFDRVFSGVMNDLVVPTRSVYLTHGRFDVPVTQRYALDSSFGVSHSTYWTENRATALFDRWLRPDWPENPPPLVKSEHADPNAEIESALEQADKSALLGAVERIANLPAELMQTINAIAGGPVAPVASGTPREGAVVVLPGIMGSILDADGDRVWVSLKELQKGGFARLSLGQGGSRVRAVGLNKAYAPLVSHLAKTWDVHLFPYDWRRDVFDSADHLAAFIKDRVWKDGERPVHLVAHSMGGLVARAFAASHPEIWQQIDAPDHAAGGRLLMLGTPNRGSYAIPLAFLGDELLVKGLAVVDRRLDRDDIVRVMSTFAGCYQMLPAPALETEDDHAELYRRSVWGTPSIDAELLELAEHSHERLRPVVDPERLVYIAGDFVQTPARLRIDGGKFHFGTHDRGDGRVTHKSGELEGVRTYYTKASHGALVTAPNVLGALDGLLKHGEDDTGGLSKEPAARRGAGADADDLSTPLPAASVDPDPAWPAASRGAPAGERRSRAQVEHALEDATRHYLGDPTSTPVERPSLRVRVLHASLEQVDHPVLVGHYRGIPPEGAEGVVDFRLLGALSHHRDLGDYPEDSGEVLFVEAACKRPPGALIAGLGEFGSLTGSQLRRAVTRAAVRRTLRAAEHHACDDNATRRSVGIAAVLVGTPGRFGLTVESSVRALVEGVAIAVDELSNEDAIKGKVCLEELQIVELYEARAVHAAEVARDLRKVLPSHIEARVDLRLPDILEHRRGGRPGLPSRNYSGEIWSRIEIERTRVAAPARAGDDDGREDRLAELRFTSLGRAAQVDQLSLHYDPAKIETLIRESVRRTDTTEQALALFELLFPQDIKLELDDADNLRLLLDDDTAAIPWELLAGRNDLRHGRALALRTGLLRQLRPQMARPVRQRFDRPEIDRALVVGDPPAGPSLPRLAGARKEAAEVAGLLRRRRCNVTDLVFGSDASPSSWLDIQSALVRHRYQLLHFATHGQVVADDPQRTGLVIGSREPAAEPVYLTALDFEQMSFTPDMVFFNACHVGRVPGAWDLPARSDADVNQLAANLALRLMQNGVKAVVAAGWAVDDAAARTFAGTLYEAMFDGYGFGEAVRRARRDTFRLDGGRTNTWGAYQCYGDPEFELRPNTRRWSGTQMTVSAGELLHKINNETLEAETVISEEHAKDVLARVRELDQSHLSRFHSAEVYAGLGEAYGELGAYEDAVWAYRRAAPEAIRGALPLKVVEQLANMEARLAAQRDKDRGGSLHEVKDSPEVLFDAALERLERLRALEETGERHALVGSVYKKRATRSAGKDRLDATMKALEAYEQAYGTSSKDAEKLSVYHTCLWLQMRALDRSARTTQTHAKVLGQLREQVEKERERAGQRTTPPDFWTDSALGDVAVTEAVLHAKSGEKMRSKLPATKFEGALEPYRDAFRNRSTVRERDSVCDHLRDLAELMEAQREEIEGLIEKLECPA